MERSSWCRFTVRLLLVLFLPHVVVVNVFPGLQARCCILKRRLIARFFLSVESMRVESSRDALLNDESSPCCFVSEVVCLVVRTGKRVVNGYIFNEFCIIR